MTQQETTAPVSNGGFGTFLKSMLPTIFFNLILTTVTYFVLIQYGVGPVAALAISGLWPAVELGIVYAKQRRLDELSLFVLILLVIGVASSVAFNSPKVALIKDSAPTALFGIVCLGSLLFPRPLMFFFGRRFGTDGTPAGIKRWNDLWELPGFRSTQYFLTVVWGVALLAEVAVRTVLVFLLPLSVMVAISQLLPIAVIFGLVGWTMWYAKRRQRMAAARGIHAV
jgi:hypothetical protein